MGLYGAVGEYQRQIRRVVFKNKLKFLRLSTEVKVFHKDLSVFPTVLKTRVCNKAVWWLGAKLPIDRS